MLRLLRSTIKTNFLFVTYRLLAYIVTVVLFLLVIVVKLFVYLIYKITFIIGMHRKKVYKEFSAVGDFRQVFDVLEDIPTDKKRYCNFKQEYYDN